MQPLTVSLLQTHTHWHDAAANRALFDGLFTQLPESSDVVVLPEMFSTGFTMDSRAVAEAMDDATVTWMRERAQSLQKALCGSLVIAEGNACFNRFIWANADGTVVHYDKRHLFRMAGEHEHYQAGSQRLLVEFAGWRICPVVCYDLRFPVWLRNDRGYDVLLVVANWPAARQLAWQTLLRARAIENQVYCAGLNIIGTDGAGLSYVGGSGFYAHDGEVLSESAATQTIVTQELDWHSLTNARKAFPVGMDADRFTLSD